MMNDARDACTVKIRVIPEPFKFRVISVGSFEIYSILKPYQDMAWKTLQQFQCFSLTGGGVDDLKSRVNALLAKYWDVGMKCINGDYKAATNKLSGAASALLAEVLFSDYPELKMILKKTLFGGRLQFVDSYCGIKSLTGGKIEGVDHVVDMHNGQLMGHPMSFPILCAVNAAVCRLALEKTWKKKFTLDEIPLMINGDDCLLIGNNATYTEWSRVTQEVGLIESVGKTYVTDRFAMINSRYLTLETFPDYGLLDKKALLSKDCFPLIPDRYRACVKHDVGYVNLGILVGRKKASNVDCEVNTAEKVDDVSAFKFWQSASDNFEQMNLRCKKLSIPLGQYVKSFKRFFSKVPLPLGLPKEMGGFGFTTKERVTSISSIRRPFSLRKSGAIALGEAYFAGGMSTAFDSADFPDFLSEARIIAKRLKGKVVPDSIDELSSLFDNLMTSDFVDPAPEVKRTWTVTTL